MKVSIVSLGDLKKKKIDIVVFGIFDSGEKKCPELYPLFSALKSIPSALQEKILATAQKEGFYGKPGQQFAVNTLSEGNASYIVLIGLGLQDKINDDVYRKAGGQVFRLANDKHATSLNLLLSVPTSGITSEAALYAATEGIYLSRYRFDKYFTENKSEIFVEDVYLACTNINYKIDQNLVRQAKTVSEGVCFARDLINEGPWVINPPALAKIALKEGKALGLEVEVLQEKELENENMHLLLAVGKASAKVAPPCLIILKYRPVKKAKKHIVLVGKGVTFDSGGLDIKPADGMLDMKVDMSGAAAVFATMLTIAKLKPTVSVTGYLCCVENGIGPYAYHPGDVIKSRRGLTIEINNTDAEGRLVLADALDYAQSKEKPDYLIDLATLTGACMIALGPQTAGLFCTQNELANNLIALGQTAGEDYWRLPLNEDLRDQLKSTVADMKNTGTRYGGSITAALFLKKFVNDGIAWAHLDIAGPATQDKEHPYVSKGGTGFGVRTLIAFIQQC
jgi:leucyl aminopeptidase